MFHVYHTDLSIVSACGLHGTHNLCDKECGNEVAHGKWLVIRVIQNNGGMCEVITTTGVLRITAVCNYHTLVLWELQQYVIITLWCCENYSSMWLPHTGVLRITAVCDYHTLVFWELQPYVITTHWCCENYSHMWLPHTGVERITAACDYHTLVF
jgi:hypothetical protein